MADAARHAFSRESSVLASRWGAPFWAPTWAPTWAPFWAPVRTGAPRAGAMRHEHRDCVTRPCPDIPVKNEYDLDQLIRDAREDDARLEDEQALEVERALVVE